MTRHCPGDMGSGSHSPELAAQKSRPFDQTERKRPCDVRSSRASSHACSMHPPIFVHIPVLTARALRALGPGGPSGVGLSGCSAAKFPLHLPSSCNPYRNTVALRGFKELEELRRWVSLTTFGSRLRPPAPRKTSLFAEMAFPATSRRWC